jgi:hypothetical protein
MMKLFIIVSLVVFIEAPLSAAFVIETEHEGRPNTEQVNTTTTQTPSRNDIYLRLIQAFNDCDTKRIGTDPIIEKPEIKPVPLEARHTD